HGWQVFGVILVVVGLGIAVAIIVAVVASGLGVAGVAIIQWVVNVLVAPFTALISAVLYFSLRRVHGEAVAAGPSTGGPVSNLG
ncbi:MAG: hypothetical protein WAN93_07425, partial [Solirubrobacteraceae bacterium]